MFTIPEDHTATWVLFPVGLFPPFPTYFAAPEPITPAIYKMAFYLSALALTLCTIARTLGLLAPHLLGLYICAVFVSAVVFCGGAYLMWKANMRYLETAHSKDNAIRSAWWQEFDWRPLPPPYVQAPLEAVLPPPAPPVKQAVSTIAPLESTSAPSAESIAWFHAFCTRISSSQPIPTHTPPFPDPNIPTEQIFCPPVPFSSTTFPAQPWVTEGVSAQPEQYQGLGLQGFATLDATNPYQTGNGGNSEPGSGWRWERNAMFSTVEISGGEGDGNEEMDWEPEQVTISLGEQGAVVTEYMEDVEMEEQEDWSALSWRTQQVAGLQIVGHNVPKGDFAQVEVAEVDIEGDEAEEKTGEAVGETAIPEGYVRVGRKVYRPDLVAPRTAWQDVPWAWPTQNTEVSDPSIFVHYLSSISSVSSTSAISSIAAVSTNAAIPIAAEVPARAGEMVTPSLDSQPTFAGWSSTPMSVPSFSPSSSVTATATHLTTPSYDHGSSIPTFDFGTSKSFSGTAWQGVPAAAEAGYPEVNTDGILGSQDGGGEGQGEAYGIGQSGGQTYPAEAATGTGEAMAVQGAVPVGVEVAVPGGQGPVLSVEGALQARKNFDDTSAYLSARAREREEAEAAAEKERRKRALAREREKRALHKGRGVKP